MPLVVGSDAQRASVRTAIVLGVGVVVGTGVLAYAELKSRRRRTLQSPEEKRKTPGALSKSNLVLITDDVECAPTVRRLLTGGEPPCPLSGFGSTGSVTGMLRQHSWGEHCTGVYGLGGYSQSSRILICMVGLPARGKSYINLMLIRYLQWSGFPVKDFNAGNLRRQQGMSGVSADFFANDKDKIALREQIASAVMEDAITWLKEQVSVCVAIFDATNSTKKRRAEILKRCRASNGITAVFVESLCDDPVVLEANYKMKLGNDDYKGMDPVVARADFLARIQAYTTRYETIDDNEGEGSISYIKLFNVGRKVTMHNCSGYLTSQLGFYLSNIHITPRRIWLVRHAESVDEVHGRLGPTSGTLTARGTRYCHQLKKYLLQRRGDLPNDRSDSTAAALGVESPLLVLIGTAPVHVATCATTFPHTNEDGLEIVAMNTSLLNELGGGDLAGVTYERMRSEYPHVWEERQKDKFRFRYPGAGGESYADVVGRLQPIIIELERQRRSVLVISHLAVQRCLYAYFTGCPMEEKMPHLDMDPRHSVVELRPGPFGCSVERTNLESEVEALSHESVDRSRYIT